jgi:hypothetical protein
MHAHIAQIRAKSVLHPGSDRGFEGLSATVPDDSQYGRGRFHLVLVPEELDHGRIADGALQVDDGVGGGLAARHQYRRADMRSGVNCLHPPVIPLYFGSS